MTFDRPERDRLVHERPNPVNRLVGALASLVSGLAIFVVLLIVIAIAVLVAIL